MIAKRAFWATPTVWFFIAYLALPEYIWSGNITWNTTSGVWDFTTANWTGDRTTYQDGDDCTFGTPAGKYNITIPSTIAPGSIRIENTSPANYFIFTNAADIIGTCIVTQGMGGAVEFAGRKQWSFGGAVISTNGMIIFSPPALANGDLCHLGTNAVILSGVSTAKCGRFRYTANTTATGTGIDQDFIIRGVGIIQTHQSGNTDAGLAVGKTVSLEGPGHTTLYLEDYLGGGNGGFMVVASNGMIRLGGSASDSREICLLSFAGNAFGFNLSGAVTTDVGLTNRLILRNRSGKTLLVTANNSAYSNGFEIATGAGPVGFTTASALGSSNAAAAKTLIQTGGYLSVRFTLGSSDLLRIDPSSCGILGIDASTDADIDLSPSGLNMPNLLIGGTAGALYTGVITPYGTEYQFGGSAQGAWPYIGTLQFGNYTLNDNLLTGDRRVSIEGSPGNTYIFRLHVGNNNNYTGGTIVKNRGLLSIGRTGGMPFGSGLVEIRAGGGIGAAHTNGTFWDGSAQFTNYLLYAGAGIVLDENFGGNYRGSNGGHGRWGDSSPVSLNGGTLQCLAGKNNTYTERVEVIHFRQGSAVQFLDGGGTSRYFLEATNLSRIGRATLSAVGMGGGGGAMRVRLASPPLTNGLMPPWMIALDTRDFLKYSSATDSLGEIGVTTNGVYTRKGASALNDPPVPADNVDQTADLTLNNSPTVNALKTYGLSGSAYTVTVTSGGLVLSGNNKTHTCNFSFPDAEAIIWVVGGNNTFNGIITTVHGLTKAGGSTLYLGANNSSTLKGPITITEGVLQLNNSSTLGQTNDLFVGYGATLAINAQTTLDVGSLGGDGSISLLNKTLIIHGEMDPACSAAPGHLTITGSGGSVTFTSESSMVFDLDSVSRISDKLVVSNANVNLNSVPITIRNFGGLEEGSYVLVRVSGGTLSGSPGSLSMPAGTRGKVSVVNNELVLEVAMRTRGTIFVAR